MVQLREKRETKAIGKATEAARESMKLYLYVNKLKQRLESKQTTLALMSTLRSALEW